ncbi:MAG TPA: recombination regulator RecX [Thiobacillaceae bacterium]|nr:recombination regulator RecX [Thiobacillaceae bacterium]HNU65073.1 recombination regulator RecX [Thiobacillaceae bacterium]
MKLRQRALDLLARREHSRAELARKLAPHGEPSEIADVLDGLERENLLSNARFAEALAHARAERYGSARLQVELRAKGVPEGIVEQVVSEARAKDLIAARAIWTRKFGQPAGDAAARVRQLRFLVSRGFPAEVARRVVGDWSED